MVDNITTSKNIYFLLQQNCTTIQFRFNLVLTRRAKQTDTWARANQGCSKGRRGGAFAPGCKKWPKKRGQNISSWDIYIPKCERKLFFVYHDSWSLAFAVLLSKITCFSSWIIYFYGCFQKKIVPNRKTFVFPPSSIRREILFVFFFEKQKFQF